MLWICLHPHISWNKRHTKCFTVLIHLLNVMGIISGCYGMKIQATLIQDLLTDYDRDVRPVEKHSDTIVVVFDITLHQIMDIVGFHYISFLSLIMYLLHLASINCWWLCTWDKLCLFNLAYSSQVDQVYIDVLNFILNLS